MLEHGRISKQQLTWLYANGLLGASLLYLPQSLATKAKVDVWITVILGAIIGVIFLLLWTTLAARFPRRSFLEYTFAVLGRPLGLIVLVPYLGYLIWVVIAMLREIVDFFAVNYPETPEEFTTLCFVVVLTYMVLSGLEVIARVNDLTFPIIFIGVLLLMLLMMPRFSLELFRPVLNDGLKPVLTPLQVHASFPYGNAVGFLMLFPCIRETKDLRRAAISGSLIGSALILVVTIFCLVTLGPSTLTRAVYPPHFAARTITVASFVAGLDGLVDIIWVTSSILRSAVFIYIVNLIVSELLGMSSHRYLVIPLGLLIGLGSRLVFGSTAQQIDFLVHGYATASFIVYFLVPLFVLTIAVLRQKEDPPILPVGTQEGPNQSSDKESREQTVSGSSSQV